MRVSDASAAAWDTTSLPSVQALVSHTGILGGAVRVVTTAIPGDVPRPIRDFNNPAFLALHPRYSAGLFTVKLFRTHTYLHPSATEIASGNTVSDCSVQSFTIPAQAGQELTQIVDLSRFSQPSDALIFELWPGYDCHIEVLTAQGTWKYVTGIGLPQTLPAGQFIGYQQAPTGDCTRE